MEAAQRKRLNVMELRCLRSMCGVTQMDCVANKEVQRKTEVVRELTHHTKQGVLRWLEHKER